MARFTEAVMGERENFVLELFRENPKSTINQARDKLRQRWKLGMATTKIIQLRQQALRPEENHAAELKERLTGAAARAGVGGKQRPAADKSPAPVEVKEEPMPEAEAVEVLVHREMVDVLKIIKSRLPDLRRLEITVDAEGMWSVDYEVTRTIKSGFEL